MPNHKQARKLFWAVLDIELPAARADFLDRECGGNSELRARVVALLSAHQDAGSFLDTVEDSNLQPTVTFGSPATAETACAADTRQDTGRPD